MERAVPVRKTHASMASLLSWSESGLDIAAAAAEATPAPFSRRSLKPTGWITPAMFGAPVTDMEAEDLSKSIVVHRFLKFKVFTLLLMMMLHEFIQDHTLLDLKRASDEVIKHLNKEQEADQSNFYDSSTNAELEVQEKTSLLEWFANEYKKFRCTLEFVTNKS
ncbi:hypothetical protein ABZP36_025697 [Zizania latifolia]